MGNVLHIVYATDDNYLMPSLVSAASALTHCSDRSRLAIDVIDGGISDGKWDWFVSRMQSLFGTDVKVKRQEVDLSLVDKFKKWHGSRGAYLRLFIPALLEAETWCVYADGDTLFTDDPLKLNAVFDSSYALQGHDNWKLWEGDSLQKKWFLSHGLGWDDAQDICSGFLIMNLKWFREHDGTAKCMSFLSEYEDVPYVDQDALAYVCRGQIGRLPYEWGMFSWDAFNVERPGCLHFCSDLPWRLMTNKYLDYNDALKLWFEYAKKFTGLSMNELISGDGVILRIMVSKVLFRAVCKTVAVFFRRGYFKRHYSSRSQWRMLTGFL